MGRSGGVLDDMTLQQDRAGVVVAIAGRAESSWPPAARVAAARPADRYGGGWTRQSSNHDVRITFLRLMVRAHQPFDALGALGLVPPIGLVSLVPLKRPPANADYVHVGRHGGLHALVPVSKKKFRHQKQTT